MDRDLGDGIKFLNINYKPLPSQRQFHLSSERFKGFSGPIGSGKSMALCHEAIKLSYLNPGRHGLIGAPTYPMLRDSTQAALFEVLNKNRIPYEFNRAENQLVMKDSGSKMLFRSVDDYERLRGTNLAWFGLDELTYSPEQSWQRLEGRLRDPKATRLCGFAVWTPKGYDWVYERFLKNPVDGYSTALAKPFENRHILDRVPDYYQRLERSYDTKFYQQEVLGEYLSINSDLVFHAFDRKLHLKEIQINPHLPLLWALDFNVDPMSSLVVQIDGGKVSVLDEIVISRASTWDACEEFMNRYPYHRPGIMIYGDSTGTRLQSSGTTDYRIIKQYMFQGGHEKVTYRVPKVNPRILERVNLTNAKLKNAFGDVSLTIDPKCRELVKDLEEVSYKTGAALIDKEKDSKRTHLSDALGYLLWEEFQVRSAFGEQGQSLLVPKSALW